VSWILLSNDDGVDSPALVPFARALQRLGAVHVVVPDVERSWVGKAITRFDPVSTKQVEREGIEIVTCSGFPADAVQLGLHTLFEQRPGLVVSGINMGYNHGSGFLMSSGTVGAAVEGWIGGVPGVAFSTGHEGNFLGWRQAVAEPAARGDWERLAELAVDVLGDLLDHDVLEVADVVSVNLPWQADVRTPRRVTAVDRVGYDQLFRRDPQGGYVHAFGGFVQREEVAGSDVEAARAGHVSITPLRMPEAVALPASSRAALER